MVREPDALDGEPIERGCLHDRVAGDAEALGAELVQRDEQDVRTAHENLF